MTVKDLIDAVDELVENPFSTAVKLRLVNELQGKIQMEVFLVDAKDVEAVDIDDIETEELMLPEARVSLYIAWMRAMLYWYMGEYDVYQNEKAVFDADWNDLVRDECERAHRGTG